MWTDFRNFQLIISSRTFRTLSMDIISWWKRSRRSASICSYMARSMVEYMSRCGDSAEHFDLDKLLIGKLWLSVSLKERKTPVCHYCAPHSSWQTQPRLSNSPLWLVLRYRLILMTMAEISHHSHSVLRILSRHGRIYLSVTKKPVLSLSV